LQTNTQSTALDGDEEQAAREPNQARLLDRLLRQVSWAEEAVEHAAFESEIAHIEVRNPRSPKPISLLVYSRHTYEMLY
jgi:hypothetical protein